MHALKKAFGITTAAFALAALPAQQEAATQQQEGVSSQSQGERASRLTLRLRDRDLREVVQSIRRKTNSNIIMEPGIEESVTIDIQDVHWRQALSLVAEQAQCIVTEVDGGVLKIEKPPRVYFAFENTDIKKVIDTIAKISGANIIVSDKVQGAITVRLKDIPWRDALDATCRTAGFVVVEEERGILRVVNPEAIKTDLEFAAIQLRFVRPSSVFMPFITSEYVRDLRNQQPLTPGQMNFSLLDTLRSMVTPDVGSLEYIQETNVIMVKDTKPVVHGAQATGCSPISAAYKDGKDFFKPVKPDTIAKSLAIGTPADGFYALKVMKETGGASDDVSDDEIREAMKALAECEGIFTETAGGVTVGTAKKLVASGKIPAEDSVVLCVTGNGLKTLDAVQGRVGKPDEIKPSLREFEELIESDTKVKTK